MTKITRIVREKIPRSAIHTSSIRRQGCLLLKTGLPKSKVIVDLDKIEPGSGDARADFLVVLDRSGGEIIPIEMKRGAPDAQKVVRQLQAGAQIAEKLVPSDKVSKFRAVLVSGKITKAANDKLKESSCWVRFGDDSYRIRRQKCGKSLNEALDY